MFHSTYLWLIYKNVLIFHGQLIISFVTDRRRFLHHLSDEISIPGLAGGADSELIYSHMFPCISDLWLEIGDKAYEDCRALIIKAFA